MAKLTFTDKSFFGRTYEFALEKTTVGRGEQNTLVITIVVMLGLVILVWLTRRH